MEKWSGGELGNSFYGSVGCIYIIYIYIYIYIYVLVPILIGHLLWDVNEIRMTIAAAI